MAKQRGKAVTVPEPAVALPDAQRPLSRPPSLADIRTQALRTRNEMAHTTAGFEAWRAQRIAELEEWQTEISFTLAYLRAAKEE